MKQDIIIISTNDWHGFWFQRQEFATRFAAQGYRVFYINRIPQRIPKPGRLLRWFFSRKQVQNILNPIPQGVRVLSPFLLPPFHSMRQVNRFLWKRFWSKMDKQEVPADPVLITYQPTFNILDLIPIINASLVVYINTHNYDADPSCPAALLEAEEEMVKRADVLMADSVYNLGRLQRYNPSVPVHRAMPGVSVARFALALRGNEIEKKKTLLFFGDIGRHLDIELYNSLSGSFQIIFVGIVDPVVAGNISQNIRILPPVAPDLLPEVLKEADILTIFYKSSSYVNGILPAKFFECLATGKPLFISGLPEAEFYEKGLYLVEGKAEKAIDFIQRLDELETGDRIRFRLETARDADWENRFNQFSKRIFS